MTRMRERGSGLIRRAKAMPGAYRSGHSISREAGNSALLLIFLRDDLDQVARAGIRSAPRGTSQWNLAFESHSDAVGLRNSRDPFADRSPTHRKRTAPHRQEITVQRVGALILEETLRQLQEPAGAGPSSLEHDRGVGVVLKPVPGSNDGSVWVCEQEKEAPGARTILGQSQELGAKRLATAMTCRMRSRRLRRCCGRGRPVLVLWDATRIADQSENVGVIATGSRDEAVPMLM